MKRKIKKRIFKPCVALFLFVWAIIPILFLSCATAKSEENNTIYRTDTLVVEKTDTVRETVREYLRDEERQKDSVSVETRNDTVFVDRWHVKETTKWLIKKRDSEEKSASDSSQKSIEKQDSTTTITTHKQDPMMKTAMYICIGLLIIIIMVLIYEEWKKKTLHKNP